MTFKMVTDSEKAAGRIAGTALAHAGQIAEEQTAKWRDRLPAGQPTVDIDQLQRFHGQELLRLRQELRETEAAHLERLDEIREARQRRDAAVPKLRELLYAYRDLFNIKHGAGGSRALFSGKPVVPADATPLRRIAHIVVANLEDPELELPPAIREGVVLKRTKIVQEISQPLVAMEAAMQELEELLPLANKSLEDKRRAHAAVDEKSAALARFLEGLYGLEGHDVLAAKVRPSSHRSQKQNATAKATTTETQEGLPAEDAPEAAEASPMPSAPVPSAPVPSAPVPSAPVPSAPANRALRALPPAGARAPGARRSSPAPLMDSSGVAQLASRGRNRRREVT